MAFWNCPSSLRTPRLDEAVENAYRIFAEYELRRPLIACHCDSCMSMEHAEALLATPLREISQGLLAEYTNSAHGYDPVNVAPQLKYFLPRYLDLIADLAPPHHFEPNACLDRLRRADWRTSWPALEREVIETFFSALLEALLAQTGIDGPPQHPRLVTSLANFPAFVLHSGGDIVGLLDQWQRSADPNAALHAADFRLGAIGHNGTEWCCEPIFNDFPEQSRAIAAWVMSAEWTARIEAAFFAAGLLAHQKLLSDGLAISS